MRHLPKMFAAIESLELNESQDTILGTPLACQFKVLLPIVRSSGMMSKEGEAVRFKEAIDTSTHSSSHSALAPKPLRRSYICTSRLAGTG